MKMEKVPTVTAQERRVRMVKGKPMFYDSPRIKSAKALLVAHLKHPLPRPTLIYMITASGPSGEKKLRQSAVNCKIPAIDPDSADEKTLRPEYRRKRYADADGSLHL